MYVHEYITPAAPPPRHRPRPPAALTQLRALMADPAAKDEAGKPWSADEDAKALLKEAEALIDPPAPPLLPPPPLSPPPP